MRFKIGFVYIPRDVDRQLYINTFYNSHKLSISTPSGGYYHNVKVSKSCVNDIVFPEGTDYGSCVGLAFDLDNDFPSVVSVFLGEDEQYSQQPQNGRNDVYISQNGQTVINVNVDADNGIVSITSNGDTPQRIGINLVGSDNNSFELNVRGEAVLNIEGEVVVNATDSIQSNIIDSLGQVVNSISQKEGVISLKDSINEVVIDSSGVSLKSEFVNLSSAIDTLVLGSKEVNLWNQLIIALNAIPTLTDANRAAFTALLALLPDIVSKNVKGS